MTTSPDARAAAMAALVVGVHTAGGEAPPPSPAPKPAGVIHAGGDVRIRLLMGAHLTYAIDERTPPTLENKIGKRGDVALVTRREADRLVELGAALEVTATAPAAPPATSPVDGVPGILSDELLAATSAEGLIAYLTQHPTERARVRALEEKRPEAKRRKGILTATESTPELDDALELEQAARDALNTPTEQLLDEGDDE